MATRSNNGPPIVVAIFVIGGLALGGMFLAARVTSHPATTQPTITTTQAGPK